MYIVILNMTATLDLNDQDESLTSLMEPELKRQKTSQVFETVTIEATTNITFEPAETTEIDEEVVTSPAHSVTLPHDETVTQECAETVTLVESTFEQDVPEEQVEGHLHSSDAETPNEATEESEESIEESIEEVSEVEKEILLPEGPDVVESPATFGNESETPSEESPERIISTHD
jgi:hypothetical protein